MTRYYIDTAKDDGMHHINMNTFKRGRPCGVVAKVLDCNPIVSEFKLQLYYYVHFQTNALGKGMNFLVPPAMGSIVSLLSYNKDGLGIKKSWRPQSR